MIKENVLEEKIWQILQNLNVQIADIRTTKLEPIQESKNCIARVINVMKDIRLFTAMENVNLLRGMHKISHRLSKCLVSGRSLQRMTKTA